MLDILAKKKANCINYTRKKIDARKPLILKVHSSVVVWLCRTSNNTVHVLQPVVLAQLNRAAGVPLHWFHINFTPYRFAWLRIIKSELQPFCATSQDCITSQMYVLFWNIIIVAVLFGLQIVYGLALGIKRGEEPPNWCSHMCMVQPVESQSTSAASPNFHKKLSLLFESPQPT